MTGTADPRPLVTIMIATRDREPELERTLAEMRSQNYPAVEVLVIDDGSQVPMESAVRRHWPEARVIRYEQSAGQSARRNEGFALARGRYVLHLDDDCHLVGEAALSEAVKQLEARPGCGCLIFDLFNGPVLPPGGPLDQPPGCVRSYIGAAALFRKAALEETAGYREFYRAQGEEDELALQLLSRGWPILHWPRIVAHHRLSQLNRQSVATWERGLGNDLWTLLIHFPLGRLPFEVTWKLVLATWDAIRLGRGGAWWRGLVRFWGGVSRAWALRRPLSPLAMRRFDAMRLRGKISEAEFADPPGATWRDLSRWWNNWRNRARDGSIWQQERNLGSSPNTRYAHETLKRP